ncbi:MAG: hypothetical protein K0R50_4836 [Eubacterium sp.]|nr:hypothetical protein [Eubacterium sp.]
MFKDLICTELSKYKRTAIVWMIIAGGFLTSVTAYLLVSSDSQKSDWETYAATGFNCINLLALLMVAVFTGYVIIGEYHGGTIGTIFTYPVSRVKVLLSKYLIILLFVAAFYLVFLVSAILFGVINFGEFPTGDYILKLFGFSLLMAGTNFVLVPVTAVISLLVKGAATYLFSGMGYFVIYISFINSDFNYLIPVCSPNKLVENYFISEYLTGTDINSVSIVLAVTFLTALATSIVYYVKSDCR